MKNRGNTGHRGYKMSKVSSIGSNETHVLVTLQCGHEQQWEPSYKETPEHAMRVLQDQGYLVIGTTRIRCHEDHLVAAQEA